MRVLFPRGACSPTSPARGRFKDDSYARLCAALALIFGTESMVVFRDVLRLDDATARGVKGWAARALVRAALAESRSGSGGERPPPKPRAASPSTAA